MTATQNSRRRADKVFSPVVPTAAIEENVTFPRSGAYAAAKHRRRYPAWARQGYVFSIGVAAGLLPAVAWLHR